MEKLSKIVLIIYFVVLLILEISSVASAQVVGRSSCSELNQYGQRACNVLWDIQNALYALGFGGAVIMVIVGGIMYTAAGSDDEKINKAKKTIMYSLIGFGIVVSFAIILGIVRAFVTQGTGS